MCAPGPMVRSGFATGRLEPHPSGEEGLWLLKGDPLSESRKGFAVPIRASGADAVKLPAGVLFELRAIGRSPVFGGRLPSRLQICRWRPDNALVGSLWRASDARSDAAYELRSPIPATGFRASGTVSVHEQEPSNQKSVSWWWRVRFTTQRGRTMRIRYAPVTGQPLPFKRGDKMILQVFPPDPVATLKGLSAIFQSADGGLVAVVNTGGSIASELMGGIEVTPSGRVVYSEVRQLPSLCVARLEHQSLKVRSSEGSRYIAPGTRTSLNHGGKNFKFIAHDAAVRAMEDSCSTQTPQYLSFVVVLDNSPQPPGDAPKP